MLDQPTTPAPVAGPDRIVTLDILRGFAVLGILVMNVQSYAMPHAAYFFPTAYGNLDGTDYWVWYLSNLLFNQKFITIFSMLFGAGVVLMHRRAEAAGRPLAGLHYRRMGYLLLIGLGHAYFLWEGDILVSYGLCGLFLYLFRRVRPGRLFLTGIGFLLVGSALMCLGGWSAQFWPEEELAAFHEDWLPGPELIATEIARMRGGWLDQMAQRAPASLEMHIWVFPFYMLWRAGGSMLLGMAFFKWGLFTGRPGRWVYGSLITTALLVGLPITAFGTGRIFAANWDPVYSFFIGSQYGYWASILIALGWVSGVMLLVHNAAWQRAARPLAAVGRMALSSYLLQTVLCTSLFYGHGLALFGQVSRTAQACIVVAIWVLQLFLSPLWLRRFRFGPAEWLWRSLSYRQRQPFSR